MYSLELNCFVCLFCNCSNEGHNVQMCISTGNFYSFFFLGEMPLFELRNLTKMKDTTEIVGQYNSTETAQQNCVKLCSYEGHNVQICIFTGNAGLILFRSNLFPFFCPIARHLCLELPIIVYNILKHCWSVGYMSLLTLSFITT